MSDTFRKEYEPLTDAKHKLLQEIKIKAEEMEELILKFDTVKNRETNFAMENLEQCVMWVTKAVILKNNQEK